MSKLANGNTKDYLQRGIPECCIAALSYQDSRFGILVSVVQVTLSVIGDHDARHLAVHSEVRVSVTNKHHQVHGIIPPANLLLTDRDVFSRVEDRGDSRMFLKVGGA